MLLPDLVPRNAFKSSIGTRSGSNMEGIDVKVSFDSGLEMKERKRGSGFRAENPMHLHEEGKKKGRKKKGFLSKLSDDLAKRSYGRGVEKKAEETGAKSAGASSVGLPSIGPPLIAPPSVAPPSSVPPSKSPSLPHPPNTKKTLLKSVEDT